MSDQVNYFYNFPSRTTAFIDPTVGPYLIAQTPGLDTLLVYDLRNSGVETMSHYWCGIIAPYPPPFDDFLIDDFKNFLTTDSGEFLMTNIQNLLASSYLQFIVNRNLQVSTVGGSGVIFSNIDGELLFNLQIVSPYGSYVTSGLHS